MIERPNLEAQLRFPSLLNALESICCVRCSENHDYYYARELLLLLSARE